MPEQKLSVAQEQQKMKPKFEEAVYDLLEGERQKNALGFLTYLRGMKINPRWTAMNAWGVYYKGKPILSIRIGPYKRKTDQPLHYGLEPGCWHTGHWYMRWWGEDFGSPDYLSGEFEDSISYGKFKEFIWANIHPCKECNGSRCGADYSESYFGKKFDIVAPCNLRIENLDAEGLEFTKKLLEYKIKAISGKT